MSSPTLSTSSTSHVDILFAKIEEELNSKQHVTLQLLFNLLVHGSRNRWLEERPDLGARLVFQIVAPRLNGTEIPEPLKQQFLTVLTILKTCKTFTRCQVEESVEIVCKHQAIVPFNSFLLRFSGTEYFTQILKEGGAEEKKNRIEMDNFSEETIRKFKEFAYLGKQGTSKFIKFKHLPECLETYQFAKHIACADLSTFCLNSFTPLAQMVDSRSRLTHFRQVLNGGTLTPKEYEKYHHIATITYLQRLKERAESIQTEGELDRFIKTLASLPELNIKIDEHKLERLYNKAVKSFGSYLREQAAHVSKVKDLSEIVARTHILEKLKPSSLLPIRSNILRSYLNTHQIPFYPSTQPHYFCVPFVNFMHLRAVLSVELRPLIRGLWIASEKLEESLLALATMEKVNQNEIKEIVLLADKGREFISQILHFVPNIEALSWKLDESCSSMEVFPLFTEALEATFYSFAKLTSSMNIQAPSLKYLNIIVIPQFKDLGLEVKQDQLADLARFPLFLLGSQRLYLMIEVMANKDLKETESIRQKLSSGLPRLPTFQNYQFSEGKLKITRDLKKYILFLLELKEGILK